MKVNVEKANAAGPVDSKIAATANGVTPAKRHSVAETVAPAKTAGAMANAKLPDAAKQVVARKAVAPKLLKKKATVLKPAVARMRCFAQMPVKRAQCSSAATPASNRPLQFPVLAGGASSTSLDTGTGLLSRLWRWIRSRQMARSGIRRLRVATTASLGEKRFVAVIQVDGLQFLVGGGATNVVLLAQLDAPKSFGDLLNQEETAHNEQPALEQMGAQA